MEDDEMLFRNLTREEQGNIAQHLVEQEEISAAACSFQIEGLGGWNSWHDKKLLCSEIIPGATGTRLIPMQRSYNLREMRSGKGTFFMVALMR